MLDFFTTIDDFVWGPPLLVLLVGTGDLPYNSSWSFCKFFVFLKLFKLIFAEDKGEGDISSFAALATALAATVGTGNIVGVATAIKTGGPGALFWMWIAAFFGMATKYSEVFWLLNSVHLTTKVMSLVVQCITSHTVFLGNGKQLLNLWPTSLPLQVCLLHGWGLVPSLKLTQSPLRFKIALTGHQKS